MHRSRQRLSNPFGPHPNGSRHAEIEAMFERSGVPSISAPLLRAA